MIFLFLMVELIKNLSLKNISMLENFHKKLSIYLVVTSKFKGLKKINEICKKSKHNYFIIKNTKNISKYMGNSKLAIINGGNTRYELCMTGTPILAISLTIQQILYNKPLTELKIGQNLGIYNEVGKKAFLKKIEFLLDNENLLQKISSKMIKKFLIKTLQKNKENFETMKYVFLSRNQNRFGFNILNSLIKTIFCQIAL